MAICGRGCPFCTAYYVLKVKKLHSESVQHFLDGVLINIGALCNMVGKQTWNSLKLKHIKINVNAKSQMRNCLCIGSAILESNHLFSY